jgi:RimJ/RimL family protein N-acetyltransferase
VNGASAGPVVADATLCLGRRVAIRRLRETDLRAFQAYRHDPQLGLYQGWQPQSDQQALAFIAETSRAPLFPLGQWVQLGIAERTGDRLIGDIGICVAADGGQAEIGFTLEAAAQGRGLATEAVRAAIGLVFERTAVARVVAVTDARNLPSVRMLDRLGMRRVETVPAVFRGEACVEHVYTLSRHEAGLVAGAHG